MFDFTSRGLNSLNSLQFDSRRGKRKKESSIAVPLVAFPKRTRTVPKRQTFPFPACDTLQNTTEVHPLARLSDEWGAYLLITLTGSLLHTSYATRTYRLLYVTSMFVWSKDLGVLFCFCCL